jgi:hypothetical protein
MARIRRIFNFVVFGALLGVVATSWLGPKYLAWDNSPTFGKALCDCAEVTRQTASKLMNFQMYGFATGAILGAIVGVVTLFMLRGKKAAVAAPPAAKP